MTLLPSAAALTVSWMRAHPALVTLHGGRVGTKLSSTLPAIRVQRIGGTPSERWRDEPVMQVECWGTSEGAADDLSRTVVDVLPDFRSDTSAGRVLTYSLESGPYWAPDDPTMSNNSRYILTVRLLITKPI